MNNEDRIYWEIEKASYQEVIKQFTKGRDARMEINLDNFISSIESKIEEINNKLNI